MDINQAFPSNYLKASDLQGREVSVTMNSVEMTTLDDGEQKPLVHFNGKQKGLILNKTNANTIAGLYGPDTDNWQGQAITLFPTQVDFQGRQVECIRVKINRPAQQTVAQQPVAQPELPSHDINDDSQIPF